MLLYESQKSMISALAFSPDGMLLASGDREGGVMFLGLDGSAESLPSVEKPRRPLYALSFHPSLPMLAVGGEAGWSCHRLGDDGRWNTFGPTMPTPTTDLAFIDHTTLAVGLGDRLKPAPGRFELWDVPSGRKVDPFFPEAHGVRAIAACPRKKIVAWAASQRHVSVWDTRKQDPLRITQPGHCLAIAINREGTLLAVTSDWITRVYDLENKREMHMLKVHKGQVASVAFSPDGHTLATGSWDRTVRLWDPQTGREQSVYEWPIGRINRLVYSPDGARLAAGGDTGGVVVWDVE